MDRPSNDIADRAATPGPDADRLNQYGEDVYGPEATERFYREAANRWKQEPDAIEQLLANVMRLQSALAARDAELSALTAALEPLADVAQFVLDRITEGATSEERFAMKDAARIAMDAYRRALAGDAGARG
jgi:ABC-type transporter Mla subunit MlaD